MSLAKRQAALLQTLSCTFYVFVIFCLRERSSTSSSPNIAPGLEIVKAKIWNDLLLAQHEFIISLK